MRDARWRPTAAEVAVVAGRGGTRRRTTWAGLALLPAVVLAGCGEDEVGAKPDLPSETPALWNPCDALDSGFIRRQYGSVAEEHAGSPSAPECRFAPAEASGQPVVTANYQLFDGDLEEFWGAMGQPEDADVRTPRVRGADGARIVVNVEGEQLYVTGFVQNGNLFEVVNVVDPAPYDERRVVRATEATLARLSAHADEAGAGSPADDAS